jgi:hypothetical protein
MTAHPIIVAALLVVATPAFAQYCITNTSDPNYDHCKRQEEQWRKAEEERQQKASQEAYEQQQQRDAEYAEEQRRTAPQRAEQARQQAEYDASLKALRAKLLASPALPPDRNPLLGRWQLAPGVAPRGGDDLAKLMGMLSNPGGAMCEVVFGGGIIEFKPGSWASNDSAGDDSLGPIQYRTQDKQVFALPDQGMPLLGFDIVDGSTIREFRLQDCVLVRVGAQPTAAPARAAQTTAARSVPVLTWDDDRTGYQCPDGVQRLVVRCIGPNAGDGCQVQEMGLPGYGARMNFTANFRGALAEQLATCQPSKVTLDAKGRMIFPR